MKIAWAREAEKLKPSTRSMCRMRKPLREVRLPIGRLRRRIPNAALPKQKARNRLWNAAKQVAPATREI